MKAELTKAGKSITVYSPNVDGLNYDQAYGVPVRTDGGEVIGFVSDVDEKHIYMHIFDKETLDMEQPPMSFEIISKKKDNKIEVMPLGWNFTTANGRVVRTGTVMCNGNIFNYVITYYSYNNKKHGLNGGKIKTLSIYDDMKNLLAVFDNGWKMKSNDPIVKAVADYFGNM